MAFVILGTGFIGRNFVHYLVSNNLVSKIRVADKVLPHMAWMSPKHKEAFDCPVVEFKHSNLINPASVQAAFSDPEGEFGYVVNLAAETKYGQSDPVYAEGIVRLSLNCAREAAKRKVKMYIEFSSGQMHSSEKKPVKEDTKCDPWTNLAKYKLEVEQELQAMTDLQYAIVRPAIVYGVGDKTGLSKYCGIMNNIIFFFLGFLFMLWTKDLKMNTVHVDDVCRAIWHLFHHAKRGEIYNLVDDGDTTQGNISELVSEIFNISYDFVGSLWSNFARVNMDNVVEDINEKHMAPWADACVRDNIRNTPLNPFLDQELLYNKHLYLNGSKLKETGFILEKPKIQTLYLQEVLEDYLKNHLFPPSLLSDEVLWTEPYESEETNAGMDNEMLEGMAS
ncbi:hypothetical protein ACJMK2_024834 [Sinanodonta woodiana]|uniref:NAD-dependent epimerase/dehydratase domain-containing protein n=1 Tax=Sinanodonta woodiana TaxID=1069815 RepID=A0ABD3XI80_SINWO